MADFDTLQFEIRANDKASAVLNNVLATLEKIKALQQETGAGAGGQGVAIDPAVIQNQQLILKITDARTTKERKLAIAELSRVIAERKLKNAIDQKVMVESNAASTTEQIAIAQRNVANAADVLSQKQLEEANAIDAVNKERQRAIDLKNKEALENKRLEDFKLNDGVVDEEVYLKQQADGHKAVYKAQLKNIKTEEQLNDIHYEEVRTAQLLLKEKKKQIDHDIKVREGLIKETNTLKKNNSAWKERVKHLFSVATAVMIARRLAHAFTDAVGQSGAFVENMNLFAVTFGKTYEQTAHWALETAKEVGLASNEVIRFTGLFKQLSTAIGIADETGTEMSKTLTQLGYDFASFYNIDTKAAMEKLQAGIFSGQTKPLRSIGIDITYQSIDHLLETNEALAQFNTSSKKLDQSQKSIARTILVMQAGENAFGDMKKTIETLQNQIRVFQASLQNLKLAIGDAIQEPVRRALVYINAFLIALTEMIRAFHPIKAEGTIADSQISELGADAEESAEGMDKLNGTLASFDKFNVLGGEKKGAASIADSESEITEALKSELEKQQEIYKERVKMLGEATTKAQELATKIKEFFMEVDGDGNFVSWTPQVYALFTLFTGISLILTGSFIKHLVTVKGIMSGILASVTLLVAGITSMALAWKDMATWEKAVDIILACAGAIIGVVTAIKAFHMTVPGALAMGAALAGGIMLLTTMFRQQGPQGFANGGITDANFIMTNENGKREWVGQQANHTAVVNDSQMTDVMRQAVAQGVYEALYAQSQNSQGGTTEQTIDISIDGDKIFNVTRNVAKRQGLDFARV